MRASLYDLSAAALALAGVVLVTLAYTQWLPQPNATIVALTFLLVVLVAGAAARLRVAVITSVAAMLCFNFFFLPPVGTFTIADPQNWVALVVFLAVSLVASRLSHLARARAEEAVGRRDELARLFDFSRDVLQMTPTPDALSHLAGSIARRFDLPLIAIALPGAEGWTLSSGGSAGLALDERELTDAFDAARRTLEFDARERTYAGHRTVAVAAGPVRLVPLRTGTTAIGLLAAGGRAIEPGTLDTLAGLVAIAIERMRLLEERKAGELTRRSEELKTALLASHGHYLRTPLTAIRIAASNLKESWLSAADRDEQAGIVLAEVEQLTRLFDNVLQMARIDAGAIERAPGWTQLSELVAAARDQVNHALADHHVAVAIEPDAVVQLDPRLAATALAHVLENAAKYAPPGSPIELTAGLAERSVQLSVRDHGPGIAAADLPHLFDRFYRGTTASQQRVAGTGLGLWIARELLAAEGGRIWAENCADGGSRFTLVVPISAVRPAAVEAAETA